MNLVDTRVIPEIHSPFGLLKNSPVLAPLSLSRNAGRGRPALRDRERRARTGLSKQQKSGWIFWALKPTWPSVRNVFCSAVWAGLEMRIQRKERPGPRHSSSLPFLIVSRMLVSTYVSYLSLSEIAWRRGSGILCSTGLIICNKFNEKDNKFIKCLRIRVVLMRKFIAWK